ncbi:MAG TPA: aldo/keto reductase [Acidimicrobiales bacterium]
MVDAKPVAQSGTFTLGSITVHRLGFGAMRLTGRGVWGEPRDRQECIRVLRRAVDLGVDFIDTADSYGPYVSEDLIREALHPYPEGLTIATKAGLVRTGPGEWHPVARPEYLRQEVEMSLRRLAVDSLDLFQLHRIDPEVPADDQFGLLSDVLREGKVKNIGLSNVSLDELLRAQKTLPVVTVQNRYNLTDRSSVDVLDHCAAEGIGFIPWHPIAAGRLAEPGGPVDDIAKETGATPAQISLAWLLANSPVILPIPGTSSVGHLEENCNAAKVHLTPEHIDRLNAAG